MQQEALIPIISAGAALSGVLISQAITLLRASSDKKHDKNKLLRQKYEEMMFHFSASLEWIRDLDCSITRSEVLTRSQSKDARNALSLCLMYFPDLVDAANGYVYAQSMYYSSVVTSFRDGIPANAGAQALVHNKVNHQKATANLIEKKNYYENVIVSNSKKYTKA